MEQPEDNGPWMSGNSCQSIAVPKMLSVIFLLFRESCRSWTASPDSTATLPNRLAPCWPPASRARHSRHALPPCFWTPLLPLHTKSFPHRPQRWIRHQLMPQKWLKQAYSRMYGDCESESRDHCWGYFGDRVWSCGSLQSQIYSCLAMWKNFLTVVICTGGHNTSARSTPCAEEGWHEATTKTTIRADNEVEAHREANNYKVAMTGSRRHSKFSPATNL